MSVTTQLGDLTATYDGRAVEIDGPGTAVMTMDLAGNVTAATLEPDDPAYPRMVTYGLRVLGWNIVPPFL
jgi:hypothetical protein